MASAPAALVKIGHATEAVEDLRPLLQHDSWRNRAATVRVLSRLASSRPSGYKLCKRCCRGFRLRRFAILLLYGTSWNCPICRDDSDEGASEKLLSRISLEALCNVLAGLSGASTAGFLGPPTNSAPTTIQDIPRTDCPMRQQSVCRRELPLEYLCPSGSTK